MTDAAYGKYAAGEYLEYQKKYATTVRESDKVIIEHVRRLIADRPPAGPAVSVLDIGCSSGNLLRHLKHQVAGLQLTGGDAFPGILEHCRQDPSLAGIDFRTMDLLDLPRDRQFDAVVVNAVLFLFDERGFDRALENLAAVTRTEGRLIVFDLFHAEEQGLTIVERSETHPDGLTLHFRAYSRVQAVLDKHGFGDRTFTPFAIPIDLARPQRPGDITSHTVRTEDGQRLIFRGTLFTPWCHLVAEKR
jgi:SAM-dependent methyltransferase